MMRLFPLLAASFLAFPMTAAAQDSKEESCQYQAQVVTAIQQARRDRVRERNVVKAIAESEPDWPEKYNNAIPLITPWVYEQPMKIIRKEDLGAAWLELCLSQG